MAPNAAVVLLGLPDDLLSGALARFCSSITLAHLAATCTRLRGLCKQAAEVLLEEAGAAATTLSARAAGAATLLNLALLCGRAPMITERFYRAVEDRLADYNYFGSRRIWMAQQFQPGQKNVTVDWAALQLLFVAFGTATFVEPHYSRFTSLRAFRTPLDAALSRAIDCMHLSGGWYCRSFAQAAPLPYGTGADLGTSWSTHGDSNKRLLAERSIVDHNSNRHLRACHVMQALHICDRSSAPLERMRSLIDWRSNLQELSAEDATDDDLSPSFDDGEGVALDEPREEFEDVVGVVIGELDSSPSPFLTKWVPQWYKNKEDFFDSPSNFPEEFPMEGDGGACNEPGCCHHAFCWMEHGCMCMPAAEVFKFARRLHDESGADLDEDDQDQGVDLAAHFVSSELWRRVRTPCPAAAKQIEWLARHAAWRREGRADASAKLDSLGLHVTEGVPYFEVRKEWTEAAGTH